MLLSRRVRNSAPAHEEDRKETDKENKHPQHGSTEGNTSPSDASSPPTTYPKTDKDEEQDDEEEGGNSFSGSFVIMFLSIIWFHIVLSIRDRRYQALANEIEEMIEAQEQEGEKHELYLYRKDDDDEKNVVSSSNWYDPVRDYFVPTGEEEEGGVPSFLDPQDVPRVVEYYAPWCGHCIHFKKEYVQLAKQVSNAFQAAHEPIEFHAVSCDVHIDVCRSQKVKRYPTLIAYKVGKGGADQDHLDGVEVDRVKNTLDVRYFETLFETDLGDIAITEQLHQAEVEEEEDHMTTKITNTNSRPEDFAFINAEQSFRFALDHSVYMESGPLSAERQDAFKQWMELLHTSLPPKWKTVHDTIDDIKKNDATIYQHEDDFEALLARQDEKNNQDGKRRKWTDGCSYTCGLWELFHIMTVGVAERHTLSESHVIFSPKTAAEALREYVANFFGCEECQIHFLSMYDACMFERCTRLGDIEDLEKEQDSQEEDKVAGKGWRELALWLWEAHNDVNVRLRMEKAAREKDDQFTRDDARQERIWPSKEACPACWTDDVGYTTWDEDMVYKYLRGVYWRAENDDVGLATGVR